MDAEPRPVDVRRLGRVWHAEADALMRQLQRQRIAGDIGDTLLLCEHPEVVTIGRRATVDGTLPPDDYATAEVDRGGGLTWHGPGQLVAYPVFLWDREGERHVGRIIAALEAWVMAALRDLGFEGVRDERMQGVWVEGSTGLGDGRPGGPRKIASIGLAFLKWVSRHGFTINVHTPADRVEGLAGCGLEHGLTTSLERATGRAVTIDEVEAALLATMVASLGREPRQA